MQVGKLVASNNTFEFKEQAFKFRYTPLKKKGFTIQHEKSVSKWYNSLYHYKHTFLVNKSSKNGEWNFKLYETLDLLEKFSGVEVRGKFSFIEAPALKKLKVRKRSFLHFWSNSTLKRFKFQDENHKFHQNLLIQNCLNTLKKHYIAIELEDNALNFNAYFTKYDEAAFTAMIQLIQELARLMNKAD